MSSSSGAGHLLDTFVFDSNFLLTSALILTAFLFCITMLYTAAKSAANRQWVLWPLLLAAVLESAGFIALAYHSQHLTNHVAYSLSFAATTMAPSLVAMATFVTFGRLVAQSMSADKHQDGSRRTLINPQVVAPLFVGFEIIVMIFLGLGVYEMCRYLSPAPIQSHADALTRLGNLENADRILKYGHLLQVACLSGFCVLAIASRMAGAESSNDAAQWKRLRVCIHGVNGLNLLRSIYKLATYSGMASTYLYSQGEGSPWELLWDTLPILLAMSIFCIYDPIRHLPAGAASWHATLPVSTTFPEFEDEKSIRYNYADDL